MKLKSLMALAIALLCSAGAWADDVFKDITIGKITNPSFEEAGATVAESTSAATFTTGWKTTAEFSYGRYGVFNSSSTPGQNNYGTSSPSAGTYYLIIRTNNVPGDQKNHTVQQASSMSLPKGTYRVFFDYKAACDVASQYFTFYAKNGSTTLNSKKVDISKVDKNTSYFSSGGGADWTTSNFDITLAETKDVTLSITCTHKSRSAVLLDNFLLKRNLTQSLISLLTEANTFYDANTSYSALKAVIDATNISSTDADDLESQYNTLNTALELARAQKQWKEVWDELDALDETALPAAAKSAITSELAKSVPTTTASDVNTAKAALQALIDSYAGIKAAYDKVNALITLATNEKTYSAGDGDAKSTLNTAITTATTNKESCDNADDLNTVYSTLETARQTYVTSGAEPAAGHPFEVTFKIVNPSFENDKKETSNPAGWTIPNKGNQYGAKAKGSMSNVEGNYYFNNWQSWWMDCNVEQTISSLPNGRYEVTAVLASYSGTSANLQAGSGSTDTNMTGENNGIRVSVNGDVTSSSLTIRARAGRKNDGSLLRADDFTLSFIGLKPVLNDLITSATDMTTPNVGPGVFQIPSSAASTLSDAIDTAQDVYNDDSAYGSTIQDAIDDLNTAIETFQGTELNAPLEATPYNLYLSDGGASYAKTLTFKDGNADAGTYAIGLTEDAGSAFNQAVHFKAVDGETNQYNIYIVDADGTKHYLCTGDGGGYGGTTEQIRVTTTEANALDILLVASNTENGVYYLKNTESSNALIGTSDGGFYTTTKYNKFNINAATQCEVPVAVNSGKWGTRIFPFEVTSIPDGLEAYTTSSVSGSTVVLSDALSSIPANTPVLLKASKDVNETLQGYGTAKQDSYTSGLLTGFYTPQTITAGNYVLQTQGGVQAFYRLAENATANQVYRAYLTAPAAGDVKAFYFDFNDATAISETLAPTGKAGEGPIYNLAGQKMSKLQKGVNIVNGKKVLVK